MQVSLERLRTLKLIKNLKRKSYILNKIKKNDKFLGVKWRNLTSILLKEIQLWPWHVLFFINWIINHYVLWNFGELFFFTCMTSMGMAHKGKMAITWGGDRSRDVNHLYKRHNIERSQIMRIRLSNCINLKVFCLITSINFNTLGTQFCLLPAFNMFLFNLC